MAKGQKKLNIWKRGKFIYGVLNADGLCDPDDWLDYGIKIVVGRVKEKIDLDELEDTWNGDDGFILYEGMQAEQIAHEDLGCRRAFDYYWFSDLEKAKKAVREQYKHCLEEIHVEAENELSAVSVLKARDLTQKHRNL